MAGYADPKFCIVFIIFIFIVKTRLGSAAEATNFVLEIKTDITAGTIVEAIGVNVSLSTIFQQKRYESPEFEHHLAIYAEDTFILDADITARYNIKTVAIFAQTWIVTGGYRQISLVGRNGETKGRDSTNGMPGDPGKNGGHFLGIYKEIHGAKFLDIDVSGGHGGNGENGKDGMNGNDGAPGKQGKSGTNGGDGGVGGVPGKPGHVLIFGLSRDFKQITITKITGQPGKPGKGGLGGKGGKGGKPVLIKQCPAFGGTFIYCRKRESLPGKPGVNGKDGEAGANYIHQRFSEKVSVPFDLWANQLFNYTAILLNSTISQSKIFRNDLYTSGLLKSNIITPLNFADDFLKLETLNFQNCHHINYTYEFEALLDRMRKFQHLNSENIRKNESTKAALKRIESAVLTRLSLLKKHPSFLIVDVVKYSEAIVEDLKQIGQTQRDLTIIKEKSKFTRNIQKQSASVTRIIENTMVPEINHLSVEFQQVLNEATDEMLDSFNHNKNLLEENIKKYRDAKLKSLAVGVVAGSISTLFSSAKGAADFVNQVGSITFSDSVPSVPSQLKLRGLTTSFVQNKTISIGLKLLKRDLSSLNLFLRRSPHNKLVYLRNASKALEIMLDNNKTITNISEAYKVLEEATKSEMQSTHTTDVRQSLEDFKSQFTRKCLTTNNSSNLPEVVKGQNRNIFELEVVKVAENDIQKAENAISLFQNAMKPFMEDLFQLSIDEKFPLRVQNKLRELQKYVADFLKGLHVEGELQMVIDKLKNVMAETRQLYEYLNVLQDKVHIVNFISSISMWNSAQNEIRDERIAQKITEINLFMQLGLVNEEYRKILQSGGLQVFPYANQLNCEDKNLQTHANASQNNSSHVTERASRTIHQISTIVKCMQKQEAAILDEDSPLLRKTFSDRPASQPFCTWSHSNFSESIVNFMKGNVVLLKCDFRLHTDKSAIKFKSIYLNLMCANRSHQKTLNKDLSHFQLNMAHSGRNMYNVNKSWFRILSERIYIVTCFQQTQKAVKTTPGHCIRNNVKDKIDSGKFMLSPFTVWEFQITDPERDSGLSISDLEKHYKLCSGINLNLAGEGIFIDNNALSGQTLNNMMLDVYYHAYKVHHDSQ